jgi:hypothetical protein
MPKTKFSTNGTKPVETIENLENIETLETNQEIGEETAMTSLVNIDQIDANFPIDTPTKPRQPVTPSIKLEGLKVEIKPVNNFSQETINSLIALSESLGIDPEVAIAKILDAVFGDNGSLITLYRQIAVKHRERKVKEEIGQIEQIRQQKTRELAAIELELTHRHQFPSC